MSVRSRILGGRASQPLLRTKKPSLTRASSLQSLPVARAESRRANSRGVDRHRLIEQQAIVRAGDRAVPVELVNVSANGAMVRGDLRLKLWDQVKLVLGEGGELDCAARWIKDDGVGLEFAHETRLDCTAEQRDELLRAVIRESFPEARGDLLGERPSEPAEEQPATQEARAAQRHPLIWKGFVHHDYDCDPVRIRNVSTTGALIQTPYALKVDATVYLELGAAGKFEAKVCWSCGGQSGLAFTEPFDIHALAGVRPDVADQTASRREAFGSQADAWAPEWHRSTVDEIAIRLAG